MIEVRHSTLGGDWAFQWMERDGRKRWVVAYSKYSHSWQVMVNVYVPEVPTSDINESFADFPKNWRLL